LTFLPNANEEEGVFSAAAIVDESGNVLLYYGAMDAGDANSTQVDSDIRLAISSDGLDFTDLGDVISHSDPTVWGYGDELFPLGAFHCEGAWYVCYTAKGKQASWDLGLARGSAPGSLQRTVPVLTRGPFVIGGGDVIPLAPREIALFLVRDFERGVIEVRRAGLRRPDILSAPLQRYSFAPDWRHATIYLDRSTRTWFMYHRHKRGNEIYVRTAPVLGAVPISSCGAPHPPPKQY
jgi:hypothetical protein